MPLQRLVLLLGVLLMGCAGSPREPSWFAGQDPRVIAGGHGVAALDTERVAQVGDFVRYEVEVHSGDAFVHRWSLDLELLVLPDARRFPKKARSFDPVSGRLRTKRGSWAHTKLGELLDQEVVTYRGDGVVRVRLTDQEGGVAESEVSAGVFMHVWQRESTHLTPLGVDDLLRAMLRVDFTRSRLLEVIRTPSLLSLAKNLGQVSVMLGFPGELPAAVMQDTAVGRVPVVWVPMSLDANGEPALDCKMLMTWKQWPLLLSAGVIQLEAHHPDDPLKRVSVRLVEAR